MRFRAISFALRCACCLPRSFRRCTYCCRHHCCRSHCCQFQCCRRQCCCHPVAAATAATLFPPPCCRHLVAAALLPLTPSSRVHPAPSLDPHSPERVPGGHMNYPLMLTVRRSGPVLMARRGRGRYLGGRGRCRGRFRGGHLECTQISVVYHHWLGGSYQGTAASLQRWACQSSRSRQPIPNRYRGPGALAEPQMR